MDPMAEEQLDYEDEEYGQKAQYQGGGAIPALAEEELMVEEDEYDDLYNDVNVGEGFLQLQRSETVGGARNGGPQVQRTDGPVPMVPAHGSSRAVAIPADGKVSNAGSSFPEHNKGALMSGKGVQEGVGGYTDGVSQRGRIPEVASNVQVGNAGFRGAAPMAPRIVDDPSQVSGKFASVSSSLPNPGPVGPRAPSQVPINQTGMIVNRAAVNENTSRPALDNGATMLFIGELHWWTTDAELENVLSHFGRVKEIKFFDERASGKSKGYCQVEFFESAAATACKEGMNGHMFNGRACVVAFASPQTLKQMGASYMNKTQMQNQSQPPVRRPMNDGVGRGGGMNYSGGDTGRNYGRGGWGRGGQGMINRGQGGGGPMRGRGGGIGPKNMVGGNGGIGSGGGNPYGQGLAGPAMGGPPGGMMHPQNMMGAGFDPTYMGRGGGYGGYPGAVFPGMMASYPGVNTVGLPGVAPHVNPAFFGRGMAANGMGMMGSTGMDGHHAGMWTDTSMGGWGGDEQGRTRESSYGGDDGGSDYGYGEANNERAGRSNVAPKERDRGSERDWSGNSERRQRDEREHDWDRTDKDRRYREDKDGFKDHRQRDRDWDNEDDWDGQPSSRARSKSKMVQEDDYRSRSRDVDYGKRRRLPSE